MAGADIRAVDIGMLRAFDALVREKSVSRAAARLFLSQPAVSALLTRLRRAFDDPLFVRGAHGVEPTPRALALAPQVERVLADIAGLLHDDAPFDPARSDRIFRIAGSDHAGGVVLPVLWRALDEAGSAARIVWEPPAASSVPARLAHGDIDAAVIASLRPLRDVDATRLYEDRYVWAVRAGHPRAAEPLTLELFCDVPQTFLGYGSSVLDDRIDEILARLGRRRRAAVAVTGFAQVLQMLERCDHAAVLGSRVAAAHAERLAVQPLPFELPPYRLFLCSAPGRGRDPALRWLLQQVVAAYGASSAPRA